VTLPSVGCCLDWAAWRLKISFYTFYAILRFSIRSKCIYRIPPIPFCSVIAISCSFNITLEVQIMCNDIRFLSNCFKSSTSYKRHTRWRSGWGTALQIGSSRDRFPMVSLEFFIDIMLPTALRPWGRLSL
jgi:hypothetical protein